MAKRYTDKFRRDVVRIATTSGLMRPQLSSDLGVGLLTLNKGVQQHQHDDLMSGPHEDVEKRPPDAAFAHRRDRVAAPSVRFLQVVQFSLPVQRMSAIRPEVLMLPKNPVFQNLLIDLVS
jgi:transposase